MFQPICGRVVFVQLSSFTGRTPESLHKSPSDHLVPTLVVALPLLLLSYTYFNYCFTVFVFSLTLNFKIWNGRPKMLYSQTSLSLVHNLERVLKGVHCYCATYQLGIVACLRLEPKSYSTRLYSLHRRCSFGPVVSCCSGSRAALWAVRTVCRLSAPWSCLCAACFAPWSWWPTDVAVAACWSCIWSCRCGKWRCNPVLIKSWRCAAGAVLCGAVLMWALNSSFCREADLDMIYPKIIVCKLDYTLTGKQLIGYESVKMNR